jgi:hypothetical protein
MYIERIIDKYLKKSFVIFPPFVFGLSDFYGNLHIVGENIDQLIRAVPMDRAKAVQEHSGQLFSGVNRKAGNGIFIFRGKKTNQLHQVEKAVQKFPEDEKGNRKDKAKAFLSFCLQLAPYDGKKTIRHIS